MCRHPSNALQVRADLRTIRSSQFASGYSLRFPRIERIRYGMVAIEWRVMVGWLCSCARSAVAAAMSHSGCQPWRRSTAHRQPRRLAAPR